MSSWRCVVVLAGRYIGVKIKKIVGYLGGVVFTRQADKSARGRDSARLVG